MRTIPLLVFALFATGCPNGTDQAPIEANDREPRAVCLEGEPFVESGGFPVNASADGDATTVVGLRHEVHEGCERVVIDLADADGNDATSPGDVAAELLRELGVVRVSMMDVARVDPDATDATFGGSLAIGAYAVWSPDGRWTFVDVHLGEAAEAHVNLLDYPARVVIDLRPGGSMVPERAVIDQRVVVLEPRPGETSYPLMVRGYARTFEANVVIRLEQDGEDVYDDFTTATAWVDAWGHYEFTVDDGPTGPLTLHVGEHSARDGTWEGVAVELEMR